MKRLALSLVALASVSGCTTDLPTALWTPVQASPDVVTEADAMTPPLCQAVRGAITAHLVPGQSAVGTIVGDLQGTITTVLRPDPVGSTDLAATGTANHLTGEQTVQVAASSIPDLVGRTIVWAIDSRSMSFPPILHVSNTLRITAGATGNLTSHGVIDLTTLTSDFVYEGVVCP